jgi:hypothetical protein
MSATATATTTHHQLDVQIATHLITLRLSQLQQESECELLHPQSVINGLVDYFHYRRRTTNNNLLTSEEIQTLIFSSSTDAPPLQLPPSWLKTFIIQTTTALPPPPPLTKPTEQHQQHTHLLLCHPNIIQLPPKTDLPLQGGTKGSRSIVKRVRLSDGTDVYFKRPSPLLVDINSDSAHLRSLGEVIAYRINQLFGLHVVRFTQLARDVDGTFVGSIRHTIRVEHGDFQYERPRTLSDAELENDESPWLAGISRLRIVDYVMSGFDRHEGNMVYNPKLHVIEGIDYEEDVTGIPGAKTRQLISGGRFPLKYDVDLRDKMMSVTFDQLQQCTRDVATPIEIESLWLKILIVKADVTIQL